MAGGRSDIEAGKAYVTLYVKNAAFIRGLRNAQRQLSDTGASMMALGRQAAMAGAAMLVPLGFATHTFAQFDDGMRSVKAVTQATDEEFKRLTDTAAELGRTTSFTAIEVANLMAELGRAGFAPDQVNAMTGAVLNLARATGTDATLASGIMAATIRQFGLEAEDSTRVADALTVAANKTFNTVEMLGEALSYAGPVAADFNMSLEDTLAVLGSLGNVGIQASNAGTVLRRLLTITGAQAQDLEKIFGVAFVDAAGNARPLVDTLGEVNEATKNMGTALRAQKFNEAFGLLGITGASALGRVSGETKELAEALRNAGGAAAKAATEMDAGIGGAFRILTSGAEGVSLAIGKAIDEPLQQVTRSLTAGMGAISAWVDENRELVTVAATAGVALVGVGASVVAVGVSLKLAAVGAGVLGVAFKAGSVALAAFSMITTAVDAAVLTVATILAICSGAAGSNAAAFVLLSALQAAYPAIAGMVTAAMGVMATVFGGNTVAIGLFTLAQAALAASSTATAAVVSAAWAIMAAPVTPFVLAGVAAVAVMTAIAGVAAVATARAHDFSGAWSGIKSAIAGAVSTAKEIGGVLMAAFSSGNYSAAAQALWIGVRIAFWEGAEGALQAFVYLYDQAWQITKEFFMQLVSTTASTMLKVANAITNPISGAFDVGTALSELANSDFEFNFSSNADAARAELAALKAELEATAAAGAAASGATPGAPGVPGDGTSAPGAPGAPGVFTADDKSEEAAAAFDRVTESIEEQIIALREGEEAAERFRLAKEGLDPGQIDQVIAKQNELATLEKTAEDQSKAKEEAKRKEDATQEEIRRLEESLRTPQEILNDRLRRISELQDAGLSDEKAGLAEDQARAEVKAMIERQNKKEKVESTGPKSSVATFDARAAMLQGRGGESPVVRETTAVRKAIENAAKEEKERHARLIQAVQNNGIRVY